MSVRVLIAFDKFKDCMGAEALGNICASALSQLSNKVTSTVMPLSDGGEGFVEALKHPLNLTVKTINVTGPLGNTISAQYGQNSDVAVIEMAQASGLEKVPKEQRNPLHTTTHGTGDLILDAYKHGARKFIVGVGGSATNDGGLGALKAIGVHVEVEEDGKVIRPDIIYGKHLNHLQKISLPNGKLLPGASFEIACDVTSPFVGPAGATNVFGQQKGASEQDRVVLESGMKKLAKLYNDNFGVDVSDMPGAGAAGGIAGGLVAGLGATIKKGIDVIFQEYKVDQAIQDSDLVITGEGSYDKTTKAGKLVQHIRDLGNRHKVPVVVLCGRKKDVDESDTHIYDLMSVANNEDEAMKETESCLRRLISANFHEFPVLKELR